jgi:MoaA/NifB/PqqE/SkfB family radical SAM enzyme
MLKELKLSYQIAKNAWIKSHPFLLYFKPTARCNLRCKSCNRWQEESSIKEELPLDEIVKVLEKFRKAGCAVLVLWGGEPTLRNDLPEILAEAKKIGYRISMCTNCLLLPRKADDILPNLDVLLCSLDGYGDAHDEFRGVKGLFDSVVKAIEIASTSYPHCYIKIWAAIHKENINHVEELAKLARQLSVGIEFFPISLISGYNDDLVAKVIELKRRGYPIRNPDRVLKIMQADAPFECNFGRIGIHIDHQGNVYSCEDSEGTPRHAWCSYEKFEPEVIFNSEKFKKVATNLKKCNLCRLPCVLELSGSLFRSLPGMFFSTGRWG